MDLWRDDSRRGRDERGGTGDRSRARAIWCSRDATGRSSRLAGRSEIDRPETIEETEELVEAAGGSATALVVDH